MSFLKRIRNRVAVALTRRGWEAAGGGRRWEGSMGLAAPNSTALAARGPIRQRAADAYVNNAHAHRAVELLVAALVGSGFQAQSQHPDPATRRAENAAFEDLVASILICAARSLVRDGEAVLRLEPGGRLRLLAAEQLDPTLHRELGGGARIVAGVEFDADGERVAYWLLPEAPDLPTFAGFRQAVRVPAADVFHIFDPLFPGQVRGLSWLAPVLLKLRDYDGASDAALMALKVQSLLTGYVRDADGGTGGFTGTKDGSALDLSLEPGTLRVLPPGTDVTFSEPGKGLSDLSGFMKMQLREIAAGCGVMYEQLTADLSATNYSSARFGLIDFRRRIGMLQQALIVGQFLRPAWTRWQELRALAGDIPLDRLGDHLPVRFVAPGFDWVDPEADVKADAMAVAEGFKSRREVVAARGRDLDELDEERAADPRKPQPEAAS